jgi:hypothetical protein
MHNKTARGHDLSSHFLSTDVISRLPDAEVARQMREAEFQPKPWGCGRGSTELEGD